ncbi:MAG: hypothetical protein GWM98_12285 [Nitrospinaceae bacterium]|nr:hypothetical protein [Nitrospinaceae bacterium]NIR55130.1 hypothetical protein [Nitrospinaceae bacterium]NIS85550.1 hypothetical protein [Nitrospinaceae bacterium]NIT82384.1 hypothetical protein [Nitrospinaceae bacterium]NIU44597.1 hypothetical protein [Nitrospinaceae bacterium]
MERTAEWTATLGALRGQLTGFLFTRGQARAVEQAFQTAFPRSKQAHPLRKTLAKVEHELGFYRKCLKENRKWQALGLDLFQILREDGLVHLLENLEELGTLLWNIVYNSPPIQESLGLTGIEFGDVRSLFEEERVPVRNG